MMPMPPSWMPARIVACPNSVYVDGTSLTVSPVTHTALAIVNSESTYDTCAKSVTDSGSVSSRLPTAIIAAKLLASSTAGRCAMCSSTRDVRSGATTSPPASRASTANTRSYVCAAATRPVMSPLSGPNM
jgi:hypothetical protein